jgi:hypothetical protein
VQGEDGTLVYILHDQKKPTPTLFVYELYTGQDALEAHMGADWFKALRPHPRTVHGRSPELIFLASRSRGKGALTRASGRMATYLDRILDRHREVAAARRRARSTSSSIRRRHAAGAWVRRGARRVPTCTVISEVKRRSPSKGDLNAGSTRPCWRGSTSAAVHRACRCSPTRSSSAVRWPTCRRRAGRVLAPGAAQGLHRQRAHDVSTPG